MRKRLVILSTLILTLLLLGTMLAAVPAASSPLYIGLNNDNSIYPEAGSHPTKKPKPTPTPKTTPTPTPSKTVSPTSTLTPTLTPTPTHTAAPTPTITRTTTPAPTLTPVPTISPSPTPSAGRTPDPSPTHASTPSGTPTSTPAPTAGKTTSPTPTPIPALAVPVGGDNFGGGFIGSVGGAGVGASGDRTYVLSYMTQPGLFAVDASVKSDDGLLTVSIPKDTKGQTQEGWALSYIIAVRMTKDQQPAAPQGGNVIGLPYNLGPEGTTFIPSASITLHYDKSQIPAGISEGNLVLAFWDTVNSKWVTLSSTVDTAKGTITATISHFSTYAVLGFALPPAPVASSTPIALATIPAVPPIGPASTSTPIVGKSSVLIPTPTVSTSPTSDHSTPPLWPVTIGLAVVVAGIVAVTFISSRRNT